MLAKLVAAPLVAVAWLLAARMVVSTLGAEGYATYMLVAGLAVLLPFADLGLGAAVMDAFSKAGLPGAADPIQVLVSTWRLLVISGGLVALIGGVFGYFQVWTTLLALPSSRSLNMSIGLCVVVFGLGLPLAMGPRILTGLQRNHWAVAFQTVSALLMLAFVSAIYHFGPQVELFMLAPYIGVVLANGAALALGLRLAGVHLWEPLILFVKRHSWTPVTLRKVAGPMLIITTVLPLAYQLDRVILSHYAGASEVAEYSLGYQVFSPMLGVLGSAGVALWPVFARQRLSDDGLGRRSIALSESLFVAVGVSMALVVVVGTPFIAGAVADEAIEVALELRLAFALLLVIQAASYPLAMVLTDARELRLQAALHVVMLMVNLPLSIELAKRFGAPGPVVGSIVSIGLCLLGPQIFRALRVSSPATNGRARRRSLGGR